MSDKSKSYLMVLRQYKDVQSQSKKKPVNKISAKSFEYKDTKTGENEDYYPRAFVIVDQEIFLDLSLSAAKIVHKIVAELKQLNVLWYFEIKNTRDSTNIKELKDKQIIFKTETTGIFIVNPIKIGKGDPLKILARTTQHLEKCSVVHIGMIRNLRYKGDIRISGYDDLANQ